jgi:two-component system, OmpR family, sensor histidine kinase KdpD
VNLDKGARSHPPIWIPVIITALVVGACTGICALAPRSFNLANLIMVYLVGVTWIATRFSAREAILSAVLSVAAFDFFFVPPRLTFAVADFQYTITFVVMLGVSLVLSRMALRLKAQTESAAEGELKNVLLTAISHDLRTPLTVISGSAAMLRERLGTADAHSLQLITSVQNEADRLARMVRNVLDLTRFELGSPKMCLDWYTLEELIGTAIASARAVLGQRQVEVKLPSVVPLIRVDGVLFQQLLVNIFENCAKYAPAPTTITLSGSVDRGALHLTIEDSGPGFPPGTEEKVFQKLYTAHPQTRGGIGLGLTICKVIVEAHGGTIRASNRAEGGARISIIVPQTEKPPRVEY